MQRRSIFKIRNFPEEDSHIRTQHVIIMISVQCEASEVKHDCDQLYPKKFRIKNIPAKHLISMGLFEKQLAPLFTGVL